MFFYSGGQGCGWEKGKEECVCEADFLQRWDGSRSNGKFCGIAKC